MDAKAVLVWRELRHRRRIQRQVVPTAAVNNQAMLRTQLTRHHIHQPHIAAMGVEHQEFFHTGARHRGTDVAPHLNQSLWRQMQSACKRGVLGAQAHGLRGQHQHRVCDCQMRQGGIDHALHQHGIHRQGQVRPVLLGRAQRQHRDGACGVEGGKVVRIEISPAMRGHGSRSGCAGVRVHGLHLTFPQPHTGRASSLTSAHAFLLSSTC